MTPQNIISIRKELEKLIASSLYEVSKVNHGCEEPLPPKALAVLENNLDRLSSECGLESMYITNKDIEVPSIVLCYKDDSNAERTLELWLMTASDIQRVGLVPAHLCAKHAPIQEENFRLYKSAVITRKELLYREKMLGTEVQTCANCHTGDVNH